MIFNPNYPIFLYPEHVDMRKGHNTLSAVILHEMDLEPLSGALFLFISRDRKACKAIFFDGNGLVLIHKKLERGRFMSLNNLELTLEINTNDFSLIFNGAQLPISKSGKKISLKS